MSHVPSGFIVLMLAMLLVLPARAEPMRAELLYSGALRGELEPCGCTTEGDLGGIRRQASAIDAFRAEATDARFVIGIGGLFGTLLPSYDITNDFIRSGYAALRHDAVALQWPDLLYGESFVADAGLAWVAGNWRAGSPWEAPRERVVERGGVRLGVTSWLSPERSPYRSKPPDRWRVDDDVARFIERVASLRAAVDLLVLMIDRPVHAADAQLLEWVDVVVAPSVDETFAEARQLGRTWVLAAGERGQAIGRASLQRSPAGDWRLLSSSVRRLTESTPDAPRLAAWYADYERALRDDYAQRAARKDETGRFVGSAACAACHAGEHRQWQASRHARAHDSLVGVAKQFDPNCVVCHVVGYGEPGGFRSLAATAALSHVGCEACHGAGRAHAASPMTAATPAGPVNESRCLICHTPRNSPGFDPVHGLSAIRHWTPR